MRKLLPLILLACIAVYPARATYVNSGKADFAGGTTTTCAPNTGAATIGHNLWIGAQATTVVTFSISSTAVASWTRDQFSNGSGTSYVMYHGIVTSAVVPSIVITASGATTIGSGCGEYTSNFNVSNNSAATGNIKASTGSDVVAFISNSVGSVSLGAPFTQRQSILLGGIAFAVFGDLNAGSTATYTATPSPTAGSTVFMDALCSGGGCTGTRHFAQVIKFSENKNPYAPSRPDPLIFIRLPFRRERGKLAAT